MTRPTLLHSTHHSTSYREPMRPGESPPLPVHHAEDLTGPTGQAHICLGGQTYTLRITRAGKLILTK